MTNTQYYIKVKDSTGDTMRYVADSYEMTEDGDLIIECGNEEVTYNGNYIIFVSISETIGDLDKIHDDYEVVR